MCVEKCLCFFGLRPQNQKLPYTFKSYKKTCINYINKIFKIFWENILKIESNGHQATVFQLITSD